MKPRRLPTFSSAVKSAVTSATGLTITLATALATALAISPGSAHAADITRTWVPAQDTSIFVGPGNSPASPTRADGAGEFLWLSVTAEGLNRRMLLRFDLNAIPSGSVVKQATLTLYESRARDEHVVRLHRVMASWGEGASNAGASGTGAPAAAGDATWLHRFYPNTLWSTPGADFDPTPSATQRVGFANQRYTWGGQSFVAPVPPASPPRIVQDVQGWVNNPASNHGWILIGDEAGLQNAKRFESRNNSLASLRPELTVVYAEAPPPLDEADIPIPPWALALLGALLLGRLMVRSDHARG